MQGGVAGCRSRRASSLGLAYNGAIPPGVGGGPEETATRDRYSTKLSSCRYFLRREADSEE